MASNAWTSPQFLFAAAAAIAAGAFNIYQFRSGEAAHLVGEFDIARDAAVTVTLDSDFEKTILPTAHLIRFDHVSRGVHELVFRGDGFHPMAMRVHVEGPADNWIEKSIKLYPVTGSPPPATALVVPTIAIDRNRTGAEPLSGERLLSWQNLASSPAADNEQGWLYLGSAKNSEELLSSSFAIDFVPGFGEFIRPRQSVALRTAAPDKRLLSAYYRLGDVSGAAQVGEPIEVLDTISVGREGHVWARVKLHATEPSD